MVYYIKYQYKLPASAPFFIFIEYQNQDMTQKVQYGYGDGYEHLIYRTLWVLLSPYDFTPRVELLMWLAINI